MGRRIITSENLEEDLKIENHLRPQMLEDYIGQEKTKKTLKIYIEAAKERKEPLDHVLFYGPPGLGKTTLAGIIANEMGVNIKITSGPAIEKPGEMAAILNNLQEGDVLFVDEGFGSLDSDTLDTALYVLNQLTEGSCLVGIISHVGRLEESIPQKIRVRNNGGGSRLQFE